MLFRTIARNTLCITIGTSHANDPLDPPETLSNHANPTQAPTNQGIGGNMKDGGKRRLGGVIPFLGIGSRFSCHQSGARLSVWQHSDEHFVTKSLQFDIRKRFFHACTFSSVLFLLWDGLRAALEVVPGVGLAAS
ncbi:MAG: hypothetical protein U0640_04910 [Phycisphaerales bacterium]